MAFFDGYGPAPPTAAGAWLMRRLNEHHLRVLRSLAPGAVRVVEIGPGTGGFASACADAKLTYVALEANVRLCSLLAAAGHRAAVALTPPIPVAASSVDIVHASHVLEHQPTFREAAHLMCETRRAVKVGGLVSVVVPDLDHHGLGFWGAHYSHSTPFNMRRLLQIVSECELEPVHAQYLSGPFAGPVRLATQTVAKCTPTWAIRAASLFRLDGEQCYSAKMTFMRSAWVVGRRTR
jgi:hypothetical protein